MKIDILIASISKLKNLVEFSEDIFNGPHDVRVYVIDEGWEDIREHNVGLFKDLPVEFYGPKERVQWFKERFGKSAEEYSKVIPERCHAETSFGMLCALERNPEMIIEIDDDVFPFEGSHLLENHWENLEESNCTFIDSDCQWYNTLEVVEIEGGLTDLYPRGHPYAKKTRVCDYKQRTGKTKCVVNMGHWAGHPDLDAPALLYNGALDGRGTIRSKRLLRKKTVVEHGTFFALCSMNTSFRHSVIPAFYQLYMKYMGIDRFDDIWSGLFIKKVADHMGDAISIGAPMENHDKRPRDIFNDLRGELEGIVMNESLWKILSDVQLDGKSYWESYDSLADNILDRLDQFPRVEHREFMEYQINMMKLWLKIVDKLT